MPNFLKSLDDAINNPALLNGLTGPHGSIRFEGQDIDPGTVLAQTADSVPSLQEVIAAIMRAYAGENPPVGAPNTQPPGLPKIQTPEEQHDQKIRQTPTSGFLYGHTSPAFSEQDAARKRMQDILLKQQLTRLPHSR